MFKTTLFDKGEYAARAREIHVLIGVFTIAQVIVWTTHYAASADMQRLFLQTFSAALISSGVVQMGSGLYLLSAMFFWLKPSHLNELFVYSTSDLVQMQHVTIATLNIAGLQSLLLILTLALPVTVTIPKHSKHRTSE